MNPLNRRKQKVPWVICLLITGCVLNITVFLSGCGANDIVIYEPIDSPSGDVYRTFVTPEDADLHFSFEYPLFRPYPATYVPPQLGMPVTMVQMNSPPGGEWEKGIFIDIELIITPIDGDFPDAETAVEEYISKYKSREWCDEHSVDFDSLQIEKNRAIVAGVEGWEIMISYREMPFPPILDAPKPRAHTSVVHRDMFFDYKGMMWEISLYTDTGSYNDARLGYEHILRTFKILD